jgi:Domain of unknown function (DUF1998)
MSKDQLRSSQVVATFGPGAMVDLPDGAIMISGLEHWTYDQKSIPFVQESRLIEKLRRILGVQNLTLRKPPPAIEDARSFHPRIDVWRFPEWFIVQWTETTSQGFRRRRLVHLNSLDGGRYKDRDGSKRGVVPVRFVRACTRGHIGDIDWKAFVHGKQIDCPRDLWIEERGTSGDLEIIYIVCECGAARTMSQAARMELKALGSCNGARPWLGPGTKEECGQPNRLLIRHASNAYFPEILSVISIPDARSALDGIVRSLWDDFLSDANTAEDVAKLRKKPTVAAGLQGYNDETVARSIDRVRAGIAGEDRPVKEVEFEALSEAAEELGSDVPQGDFYARALKREVWDSPLLKGIERVVLVHRLREVSAQLGFTRFEAAVTDIHGDISNDLDLQVRRAPLALEPSWFPAIENRGEGIFIQFKAEAVNSWLKRDEVLKRGELFIDGFEGWKADHKNSSREFPGLPYYLLHSISHLLMIAISLECGYPGSSLRERIYTERGEYAILIYTGSSDSEGTLGGLVLTGRDLKRHFTRALDAGMLCSNDPVCALHSPREQAQQRLLGSACHGCLLISETSCEQRNDFLDRALVVPTVAASGSAFFDLKG